MCNAMIILQGKDLLFSSGLIVPRYTITSFFTPLLPNLNLITETTTSATIGGTEVHNVHLNMRLKELLQLRSSKEPLTPE